MTSPLLAQAFRDRPDLRQRILDAIGKAPELDSLFGEIAHHIITGQGDNQRSKKRKLEHRPINGAWDLGACSVIADISFSIPQRKKYNLELNPSPNSGLRATNSSGDPEVGLITWDSIRDVFCLPVPEKAQAQCSFCIFSHSDQVLWTVSESILKEGAVTGRTQSRDTYRSLLVRLINTALKPYKKYVVEPDKQEFASQIVQAHRKGDVAYHVKAFRGSKDGFLFFLPTGIVWGFKKPLEFFSFESIDSVSYTSVLQRTFNLSVAASASLDAGPQEFEFSMIDQVDFAGIDAYVKRHGLQDASMAEQRQAKKLNVNRVKGEEAEPEDSNHEGELEKAAKEADDLKDDEEEDDDFDPGSEGESEGEGSSSEEDEQGHRSEKGLDNQELDSGDENSEA